MSQRRTLWSKLQLATKSPRSWKATPHTAWVWSVYVATHFCCSKLHSFTLASPEPEARWVPCNHRGHVIRWRNLLVRDVYRRRLDNRCCSKLCSFTLMTY